MDKVKFVKNGDVLRLPPGFRFHPTDEELVVQYLKRKVLSHPFPALGLIPEVDVCKSDPWDLPGESEQERYYFSTQEVVKYPNRNRATASGYWKAIGLDKQIMCCKTRQIVGMKKTLVFYRGKGCRTHWIMHEYRLINTCTSQENWVLCRIFLKRRRNNRIYYDFMAKDRANSSSSGSSGITEISNNNQSSDDYQEISSCYNPGLINYKSCPQ